MFIAAAISAGFASYAWRRRNAPGLTAFSLLMLAVAEWSLGYGLELGGVDLPTKILWAKIEYVGIVSLPLAWLIFALQYSGRGRWLVRRRRLVAGLAVAPLITLSLVFTNEAHGLIWRQTRLEASGPFLAMAVDYGPWFWVNFAIAYLWLLSGTLVLIHRLVRSPQLYRNQAGVLLAGALVPWAGNALYVAGLSPIPQLDLTPLTFTLSGLIIGWGIFRFRLLDIMPIARNAVIESMSDGVIVVDTQNRIVDLNPAAQRMIDRPAARAIGQPLGQVFSDRSELIKRCYDETEARTEFALDEDGLKRYYELRISPLRHKRDRLIGRLIVLRDVTEQRQAIQKQRDAEAKYQRLIEQLPAISYIVTFGEVNRTTYISPQVESFLGFTPEEWLADPDLWIKLLHPDDRERVLSEVRQRDTSAEPLVLEYRTLDRAGRVLWVYNRSTLVLDESGQPLYSQGVIFDITERKRAEEAERDQRVLAEALRDTALALNSTLDFDEVLERILTNVGRVVPHDAANVMLIDQGLAYIVRHRGYVERGLAEYAQSLRLSTVDAPNLRYMIDNVQPLVIPDVRSYEGWIRLPEMSWQRSYLGAPIALEGEVIGFLNLDSTTPGTFTADHAERLQAFAAQAGVAIGNARLYDELRRRATELELQVAERRRAEAELRRQGRLLEGVARATNLLLTNRNHIAAIDQALAVLGRAAGVDRVRVFENHPHPLSGEPATSQRFEWTREPEEAQIDDPAVQNVPWRAPILSRWQRLLAKGRSLGGLVRKFPARERRVLEAQGLLSLLVMPIIIGDEFWGFIGFDDCHAERLWSQEDKSTLRTMAGSIGGALARQRAEEALARARDQALEATRIKSQFLANMSHEIRTPMNAVIGFTSVLLDTDLTAEQRDFLNSIRTSGNALLTIINDILDFSKIEASRLEMESQPFDLRACLQEAFDLVAAEAEKKGLDLSFDVEDRVPPVLVGDTTRLRQILVNLLNNAVKFTETGRVSVSVSGVEVSGDHVSGDHVS
ncbi:MAG: histidine kinase N-terminal 7TM domain-containing protein, partial [Anaerolineae bacterium]